jgi:hypothetical protein
MVSCSRRYLSFTRMIAFFVSRTRANHPCNCNPVSWACWAANWQKPSASSCICRMAPFPTPFMMTAFASDSPGRSSFVIRKIGTLGIRLLQRAPRPAYHLLDWAHYSAGRIITTQGCPYHCSFCDVAPLWGRKAVYRDVTSAVEEMVLLRDRYKPSEYRSRMTRLFSIANE